MKILIDIGNDINLFFLSIFLSIYYNVIHNKINGGMDNELY